MITDYCALKYGYDRNPVVAERSMEFIYSNLVDNDKTLFSKAINIWRTDGITLDEKIGRYYHELLDMPAKERDMIVDRVFSYYSSIEGERE